MTGVQEALKAEFPEATEAEIVRFVEACRDPKHDGDSWKAEAEKLLENYLDWRSCYGLDYKAEGEATDDAGDWDYAIQKALEVEESMKRAKELEEKLAAEAQMTEMEKAEVNYDIEFSDSQKEEDGEDKPKEDDDNEDLAKSLLQFIFLHESEDGKPIKDKHGNSILHVMPAMINRKVGSAELYGLAVSLYLDRQFDRNSDEKMTVMLDSRGGEGWPNPSFVLMANFVRKLSHIVQANNPHRFQTFLIAPVPWFALSVWNAIKRVFRYGIMDTFVLIKGPGGKDVPLPRETLE